MTRRDVGWAILRAAGVAGAPEFFTDWLRAAQSSGESHRAHQHSVAPPEPDRWTSYQPKFFTNEEFRMLDTFTAILIPTDETPGAREAHVAAFTDFVVNAAAEYDPGMQKRWRRAMDWLRAQNFAQLAAQEQCRLLEQISAPERNHAKSDEGFRVYQLIKDMAVRAFYTSRVGLIDVLEYKGLAYLTQFPGCTHSEHRKV